jgi:hypothetical protein
MIRDLKLRHSFQRHCVLLPLVSLPYATVCWSKPISVVSTLVHHNHGKQKCQGHFRKMGGSKQGDNQVCKNLSALSTVSSINRPQWLYVLLSEPTPGEYLERVGWCSSPLLPRLRPLRRVSHHNCVCSTVWWGRVHKD